MYMLLKYMRICISYFYIFVCIYTHIGEYIDNSDDEHEEGADELEYDNEFLVHDNDFGSDVGSDGEMRAREAMRVRDGEEKIGVRFISSGTTEVEDVDGVVMMYNAQVQASRRYVIDTSSAATDAENSMYTLQSCSHQDTDTVRLCTYTAVQYTSSAVVPFVSHMPYLGTRPTAVTHTTTTTAGVKRLEGKTEKVTKSSFDTTLVCIYLIFIVLILKN